MWVISVITTGLGVLVVFLSEVSGVDKFLYWLIGGGLRLVEA
ncbi:hypothetical protein SPLC1_S500430 [Arthrospira platensis C1]|nr:hypothetical protein SPLC1_S500430 [Arthrospira platensis C1]